MNQTIVQGIFQTLVIVERSNLDFFLIRSALVIDYSSFLPRSLSKKEKKTFRPQQQVVTSEWLFGSHIFNFHNTGLRGFSGKLVLCCYSVRN